MTKEEVNNLVKRYGKLFKKDKNYYAMDYGSRFNPTRDPKTNKIKYKKSPGDKFKPFWFCDKYHLTLVLVFINFTHELARYVRSRPR